AVPTITNTFGVVDLIDSAKHNENFTDIVDALTDGTSDLTIATLGLTSVTGSGKISGDYFLPSGDDTTAPGANRLYKANIPKAWACIEYFGGFITTVHNGHNVRSAFVGLNTFTVFFDRDLGYPWYY